MAFPPQYRKPPGLPSIVVPGSDRFSRHPFDMNLSSTPAMSIPGGESRDDSVPPPLPPPRFLPMEGAPYPPYPVKKEPEYKHSMSASSGYGSLESRFPPYPVKTESDYKHSISSSSGYGSLESRYQDEQKQQNYQHDYQRRPSFQSHSDEGYASYASTDR